MDFEFPYPPPPPPDDFVKATEDVQAALDGMYESRDWGAIDAAAAVAHTAIDAAAAAAKKVTLPF